MQSRQSLGLRLSQHLALTPQLQQSIRFLQLSAQDLDAELAQALEENPLLEREEEYDTDAGPAEPEAPDFDRDELAALPGSQRGDGDDDHAPPEASQAETLRQHLLRQLEVTHATARDRALVTLLIDELDENGYLPTPLEEVHGCLPAELGISPEELHAALRLLQSFDPPGVGASTLSECLLIQLGQMGRAVEPAVLERAKVVARHHLELLAAGNVSRLCESLGCSAEQLREARLLLLSLDPKPGRGWAASQAEYVVPEVLVRKRKDGWQARLNSAAVPRLRVNALYESLLKTSGVSGEGADWQAQAQRAHGLIKSVVQRFDTILRVAQSIVRHQQAFLDQGPGAMKPLLLRDIAAELGMHESTISRATRRKYMQTPWGTFELKYFFGSAVAAADGDSTSATAVRTLIQRLISEEPQGKPLSDSQLVARLAEHGVEIARRTVAKYREAAGIPPAALRKAKAQLGG